MPFRTVGFADWFVEFKTYSKFAPKPFHMQVALSALWAPAIARITYGAFSHDVTSAILVFQNKKKATMLVFQTKPVGVKPCSYVKN